MKFERSFKNVDKRSKCHRTLRFDEKCARNSSMNATGDKDGGKGREDFMDTDYKILMAYQIQTGQQNTS